MDGDHPLRSPLRHRQKGPPNLPQRNFIEEQLPHPILSPEPGEKGRVGRWQEREVKELIMFSLFNTIGFWVLRFLAESGQVMIFFPRP